MDTHTFLWSLFDTKSLSKTVKSILEDVDHEVFLSTVSFWEISLKYALGKLELKRSKPSDLPHYAKKLGYEILPLSEAESSSFYQLKRLHGDPFDLMLIWQAIQKKLILLSKDKKMSSYERMGLKLLW